MDEAANSLGIVADTVKNHMTSVYKKLGTKGVSAAMVVADRHQLLGQERLHSNARLEVPCDLPQSFQIIQGLALGLSFKDISNALFLSYSTVRNYSSDAYKYYHSTSDQKSGKAVRTVRLALQEGHVYPLDVAMKLLDHASVEV